MQLSRLIGLALLASVALASRPARADDNAEASTTLFYEKRQGGDGGLRVVHPQADVGIDLGSHVTLDAGYSADIVSGATSSVYQHDAITAATKFSDKRQEGNVGIGFQGKRSHLSFETTFGTERDYLTREIGGQASIDLPGRNTTVGIAYSHSFDQVCDVDNGDLTPLDRVALTGATPCLKSHGFSGKNVPGSTIWQDLAIDTAQATITQNISPTTNAQLVAYGQVLDGFQSNPYRRVRIGPDAPQENEPDERARWSVTARMNRFLPKLHGAVHFGARFYDDTWRVVGGDVELAYSQYVGNSMLLYFHARAYQQSAASFFKDAFFYETQSTAGQYFTGDRELSPVRNAMVGAKLTMISVGGDQRVWHLFDKLEFNLKADVLFLYELPADSVNPNPFVSRSSSSTAAASTRSSSPSGSSETTDREREAYNADMYRYGDGTPFPLDENFIETLTSAVEACTEAFVPLTELDARRDRAIEGRREADKELARLADFDKSISLALQPFLVPDKKVASVFGAAQKMSTTHKQLIASARQQVEARVQQFESQASAKTVADSVLRALRPFFDAHQLPKAQWIMSWDVRGNEPHAHAVATSGKLAASFSLVPDPWRAPIRVDQLAEAVIVHMMKKGVFGKAKPAPVELAKYVIVAFDRAQNEQVITLRETAAKTSPGLRFAITDDGATWVSITPAGDAEGEPNPLDMEDVGGIRRLTDAAHHALEGLTKSRTLQELSYNGEAVVDVPNPRTVPFELLAQLSPYARTIRERSRQPGELVLKLDIGDGRREELFVPRATLAQQFARLPAEYRRPFEDMGITSEDTQPAITLPRPPARPSGPPPAPRGQVSTMSDTQVMGESTIEINLEKK